VNFGFYDLTDHTAASLSMRRSFGPTTEPPYKSGGNVAGIDNENDQVP
jgi:hypothetical protein